MNLTTSKEGSSSRQRTMTLIGEKEETEKIVLLMLTELQSMLEDSRKDIGSEKKCYGTHVSKPDGEWDKTVEDIMLNSAESGHPKFRATSALERGDLKSKGKGIKSIHFNGGDDTIDLILQTIVSVNQLSVYGAVADLCKELSKDSEVGINGITDRISCC